ncbi:hypothetical protein BGZ49_007679 [Haplosporangium sp. Z 27]|nr:hypothetical protein BGZ49_007679 [Haplosporangium sp. Z 27]
MSRPPSIYSDALDTPHQDHIDDPQDSMDHDNNNNIQAESTSRTDMDLDEVSQVDSDISMQVDSTTVVPTISSPSNFTSSASISGGPSVGGSSTQQSQSESSFQNASGSGSTSNSARTGSAGKTSVPVVDEKAQSELRRKIMDIQRDPSINFADKARLIQKLMSSKWKGHRSSDDTQSNDTLEATEQDLKKTYHDEEKTILGCEHYMRGCKLKANCCGKWFNCRFCHDDVSDHTIVRSETKTMLCHGLGQDYFHCKKCNICMNIKLQNNHKCIERNLECDCPICGEYMFTSTTTVMFMPCGHSIHSKCHENYIRTSYQCPTCWKSLGDMSPYYSKIDSLLAEQTMPPEYANIFSIVLCNDCEVKSEAPYHFLYHKCDKCKGYNTKVLETFHRVADGETQVVENATAAGATVAPPENNNSGSSSAHPGPTLTAGSSSATANNGNTASLPVPGSNITPVNLASVGIPRSPLMDENASGDMSMAGISGNSAP